MLSPLQRYVLLKCYNQKGGKMKRDVFVGFYNGKKVKKHDQVNTVTKSLERMIKRGLLVGYGMRTAERWFIKELKITRTGIKVWERWLVERQRKLPF